MTVQFLIKKTKVCGIEGFAVVLFVDGRDVARSNFNSEAMCITWFKQTSIKFK